MFSSTVLSNIYFVRQGKISGDSSPTRLTSCPALSLSCSLTDWPLPVFCTSTSQTTKSLATLSFLPFLSASALVSFLNILFSTFVKASLETQDPQSSTPKCRLQYEFYSRTNTFWFVVENTQRWDHRMTKICHSLQTTVWPVTFQSAVYSFLYHQNHSAHATASGRKYLFGATISDAL